MSLPKTNLPTHTFSLSLRGDDWGAESSSMSELLEPDDTLIWSEWVFLVELSPEDRNLEEHKNVQRHTLFNSSNRLVVYTLNK